ncbi:NADPH-dependent FMN reductase [Aureispira anguillae]|uniref:NAD(P)H-dependent oxidoreductase n=1 Tax=Aureispira anguillae TaxID=2864201 RepID=A0A915YGE0_9BACT|nr:NAD(P)H-dependent oxidoreductase [Aureispira anguillae]BDS12483.1 NAD(P)H-dependent oxidoreductase [Aureispira anguillae]
MITVFSGTNRKNSRTHIIAQYIYQTLKEQSNEEVRFFSMEELPTDLFHADMYSEAGQSKALSSIQDEYLIPANKFYFVVPEYNGGIPGALKLFIDACSVRQYAASFHGGKKAALVGVSSGRSGALRGLEYMTGFLNYLTISVLPNKLPISSIETLLEKDQLVDKETQKVVQAQITEFLNF